MQKYSFFFDYRQIYRNFVIYDGDIKGKNGQRSALGWA